jgi:hypothetical protein
MRVGLAAVIGLALVLAGCGESPPVASPASGPQIRAVDREAATASCNPGEEILSAYCYSKQGESLAASGVAFRMDSSGAFSAQCLMGGHSIRLYCLKH